MMQDFKFVGGRYDGGMMPVAEPVRIGLELRVRSIDPSQPSEFYVFCEDGCFHIDDVRAKAMADRRLVCH